MSDTQSSLEVVILAAGKGTRMKSDRPKVLHRLAGRPLLHHVLEVAAGLGARRTVVVTGHGAREVEASVAGHGCSTVRQEPQLGTGHAVQQALPLLGEAGVVLILNGDVPLITRETAASLARASAGTRLALLSIDLDDPGQYGRIVREGSQADGPVRGIVEQRDASPAQLAIREIYTGMMAVPLARLRGWLARLQPHNRQGEYYLTDIVAMAVADGVEVVAQRVHDEAQALGVNTPAQLADLERRQQARHAQALMEAGVRLADPARLDVRGSLVCGHDVEIDVGCIFEGHVALGDGVRIGAYCVIRDAEIRSGADIQPYCHIDGAQVGEGARIGPYARLRPGARLDGDVHVGNFVEIKNSSLAAGAKANHLAYVGDATVGERVNVGAGTITANYDGVHKHRTVIEADAHIGSNCVLVAPVTIGARATIGGGSTITKDAPAGQLTVARARQVSLPAWKRPARKDG